MAASLQQFAMSQQDEVELLLFCGPGVHAAADTASAAEHARAITSALILLISTSPVEGIPHGDSRKFAEVTANGRHRIRAGRLLDQKSTTGEISPFVIW